MGESVQERRLTLQEAEAEALAEYQSFLEITSIPSRGDSAQRYLSRLTEAQTKLRRAEVARKLLEDELLTGCSQHL